MAYNGSNSSGEGGSGNVWSSGSRGGSRGGYSRSYNDDDESGSRGGGSYRGSFGNNNSRRGGGGGGGSGGGYGFRRQNDSGEVEILSDAIFIQNLPKNITREEIVDAFSTVGTIKTDDRSGGPKIWIYKDRDTGEGNGRATVTYEDDETANKAISEYNDQHIDSIGAVVRVQLAQRRPRNNDSDRGGRGGYRGGRNNWDNNNSRQGFNSGGSRWGSSGGGGGFSDSRSGGGFRGASGGGGSDSFRDGGDRGGSYRGSSRDGSYRGASRGNGGSSNYSPY